MQRKCFAICETDRKMSYEYNFSLAIFCSRKEMGITQEQAAERLGISKRWFQMIEKGEKLPSPSLLLKIIAEFDIDAKAIIKK